MSVYHCSQFALGLFALAIATVTLVMLVRNSQAIESLRDVPLLELKDWPKISLIVPARNEERSIEAALQSLLAIDYPNLQITIIDDRSTDGTGTIVRRLAQSEPALNFVEVKELPSGWLGKNHAMHIGASQSDGEWLLFTDADIHFEPTTLRRAVGYIHQRRLDHLAAYPEVRMPGWLLNSFVVTFGTMFTLFIRPWQVRNPDSKAYVGMGAFNLVRTEAYRACGGHVPIRMRPDDDVKLGHLLKLRGCRSDIVNGRGMIVVEWYRSLDEMIRGLEKNSAAPLEYSIPLIVVSQGVLFVAFIWPFFAVGITWGSWSQLPYALAVIMLLAANAITAFGIGQPLSRGLLFPLAISIFFYIQVRALIVLLLRGGMYWRGTFYPLGDLKANRIG